jgi:hypothetical protein
VFRLRNTERLRDLFKHVALNLEVRHLAKKKKAAKKKGGKKKK